MAEGHKVFELSDLKQGGGVGVERSNNEDEISISMVQRPTTQTMVQFCAFDGSVATATIGRGPTFGTYLGLYCCPCFIGGIGSQERKSELKNSLKRVTLWLTLVQLVMFIVSLGIGGGFTTFDSNPSIGPNSVALVKSGAKYAYYIQHYGSVHRLFTTALLHAGIVHLAVNLFAQLHLGMYAENKWGPIKYCVVYITSAFAATLTSCVMSPTSVSVGASGAIMGILVALGIQIYCKPDPRDPIEKNMLFQLIFMLVVGLIMGLSPYVDMSAHFGGALVGGFVGLAFWGKEHASFNTRPLIKKYLPIVSWGFYITYLLVLMITFWTATNAEDVLFLDQKIVSVDN